MHSIWYLSTWKIKWSDKAESAIRCKNTSLSLHIYISARTIKKSITVQHVLHKISKKFQKFQKMDVLPVFSTKSCSSCSSCLFFQYVPLPIYHPFSHNSTFSIYLYRKLGHCINASFKHHEHGPKHHQRDMGGVGRASREGHLIVESWKKPAQMSTGSCAVFIMKSRLVFWHILQYIAGIIICSAPAQNK